MREDNGNLRGEAALKQGENRMQTGSSASGEFIQSIELIGECAAAWDDANKLPVLLLRALVRLNRDIPDEAERGFTAVELADAVSALRGKRWLPEELDKEGVNRRVREQWNKLTEHVWPNKQLGLQDRAEAQQRTFCATLDRVQGGGTGHQTRYRLIAVIPPEHHAQGPASTYGKPLAEDGIRYVREDFMAGSWWQRFAFGPTHLHGWRLGRFLLAFVSGLGLTVLLLLLLGTSIWLASPLRTILLLGFGVFSILLGFWSVFWPIFNLPSTRITLAPSWLTLLHWDAGLLLEWCTPPRYTSRFISVVRYTAVCPVCQGKVDIESGGWHYPGRLIGRCRESPREHLFSFDHVTRSGRPLRGSARP